MDLFEGTNQWAVRPRDERFPSLTAAHAAALKIQQDSVEQKNVAYGELRTERQDDEIVLLSKKDVPARFSFAAFNQFAAMLKAPVGFLRELPATLTSNILNNRLANLNGAMGNMYLHKNGGWLVRGINSEKYGRIYHSDILQRLLRLESEGWRVPPARPAVEGQISRPATEADVLQSKGGGGGLSISIGDPIADAGIYLGQGVPELFVFMVNEQARISDGSSEGLARGFFVSNQEIAGRSFRIKRFFYRHVCGNHIVWDASGVSEIKVRHVGDAPERAWANLAGELRRYSDEGANETEAKIATCRRFEIAGTKDELLDKLFGLEIAGRKQLTAAYELAVVNEQTDGNPRSAWGMAQGITRLSQAAAFADDRNTLDSAAGKILDLPF